MEKSKIKIKKFPIDADKYSVSIIVPNYNNGRFLQKLVDSIENQTYPIKEIVIVDDCSTDDSVEIIHKLCEKSKIIVPVFLNKNCGVSNARNKGFESSTGNYVSFLDADDFYCNPKKTENEINLIRTYEPEDILAYSYMADCDINADKISKNRLRYYPSGDVHLKFFTNGFFTHYQTMKRELFQKSGGYPENMRLYEDLKLLTKLGRNYRFMFTGEYGPVYRHGTNGLSTNPNDVNKKVHDAILEEYYETLTDTDKSKVRIIKFLLHIK